MNSSPEIPCLKRDIHKKFKTILDGRSAIIISHRFSTVIMADHSYVPEQGRIAGPPNCRVKIRFIASVLKITD